MIGRLHALRTSSLMRNLAAVAGGTTIAQGIILAFSPLITRIYSPEVFGIQGVFIGLISVLWPVSAMRYPMAIVVADSDAEARKVAHLSFAIAAGVSSVVALLLLGFREPLSKWLEIEDLGLLVWFLPVALFMVSAQDVADFRTVRLAAFRVAGIVTVLQAFLVNLSRVVGGLIQPVAAVLVAVTTFSYALQALMQWVGTRGRSPEQWIGGKADAISLLALMKKYREFPIYRMPADLLGAAAQTTPVFLLTILFSPTATGMYVLARSVVNLPLNLVGSAIGNVLYGRIAEISRSGSPLFPFVLRVTLVQLLLPGGATAVVALFFPMIFAFVFGEPWRMAGEFAQWMALWVIGMLANIPSVRALPVIGRNRLHLIFNGMLTVGGMAGMLTGYSVWNSAMAAVACFSVVTAILYAIQIVTYLAAVRKFDEKMNHS